MITVKPPYLGVAYYPEDWDVSEIEKDIEKMVSIGINVARIGEFAWRKMEPRDGEFDFAWLHDVVDRLKRAGLAIVMGTPTAVPPVWLTKKYPDMLMEFKNGRRTQHSGRRHACSNHPEYLKYSARIVEKLAMEFGDEEGIIGWQIYNYPLTAYQKSPFAVSHIYTYENSFAFGEVSMSAVLNMLKTTDSAAIMEEAKRTFDLSAGNYSKKYNMTQVN